MNYATNFNTVRDEVSPQEWQARLDLAACYRLVDAYGMTDLIYNHITARIPGSDDHLLINLYGLLTLVRIHPRHSGLPPVSPPDLTRRSRRRALSRSTSKATSSGSRTPIMGSTHPAT
jgi:hypothetical protein